MKPSKEELAPVLSKFNPWWKEESIPDLPTWRRAAFNELYQSVYQQPIGRAILLSGARQVGKTTLLLQVINELLKKGVPYQNILYITFDHPLIKLVGIDSVIEIWRERIPKVEGPEYIFLDEAQLIPDWGTWIKHEVDFNKNRRIVFTGSSMPLLNLQQESGVGRWSTIRLTTLSFYEYLQLKNPPHLPTLPSLRDQSLLNLFDWSESEFHRVAEGATPYMAHFHEYLVRGGFPQTVQLESVQQAQRLLREDIIDKILKQDMTAIFGVRRIAELEQTFLYLCMHEGGLLDLSELCENLSVNRSTAQRFIELLEASHLIYRLQPFGYGKEILRGRYKIYLADAAISSAVLLKGRSILDNPTLLGTATEAAVFKHLFARYYAQNIRFTYWMSQKRERREVDLLAEIGGRYIPFEIKYRNQHTGERDLKGLMELCQIKNIPHAYVVTKSLNDFGLSDYPPLATRIMRVPATLLCYWMGEADLVTGTYLYHENKGMTL